jgi:cellulose synthase/poly-beta-1,6-N-acetylglucosamine synthase-like glycosyltransferase
MIELLFLACGICALVVVYPYTIYLFVLKRLKTKPVTSQQGYRASATLVFCAYNEAANLPEKLDNIAQLKVRYPDLEILAYDDKSSDQTLALLTSRPDLLRVLQGPGRAGKAHGMKRLVQESLGDIIIFTDANVLLDLDAIDNLIAYYADDSVGGVCGSLHYLGEDSSATAAVGSAYWRLEEQIKAEESRTGSVMGADGSIFSLRRSLYPEFPDSVLDDLTVSMTAVFAGKRLMKAEDVIAYERIVANRGDEFSRKIRIATRAFHTHLYLRPHLRRMRAIDRFKYASHKILRWFGGGFVVLGGLSFLTALGMISPLLGLAALAVGSLTVLVGSRIKGGALAATMEILIALMATQWGVLRAISGKTQILWTPAASR